MSGMTAAANEAITSVYDFSQFSKVIDIGGGHGGLDALLDRVGELEALGAEEFDAVVGHGVVGGGDHRPRGRPVVTGQEGDGRGRHHPGGEHVTAGAEDAGDQGALQQDARGPRVAADDHGRTARPGGALGSEHPDRGPAEGKGELGGQVGVGQTTNPVGPEQRSHRRSSGGRVSAWSTGEPCGPS